MDFEALELFKVKSVRCKSKAVSFSVSVKKDEFMFKSKVSRYKKSLFILIVLLITIFAFAMAPKAIGAIAISQAKEKGWNVSFEKIDLDFMSATMTSLKFESFDGRNSGEFGKATVSIGFNFEIEEISAKNGHVVLVEKSKTKETVTVQKKFPKVSVSGAKIVLKMSEGIEVQADNANVDIFNNNMAAYVENATVRHEKTTIYGKGVRIHKDENDVSFAASEVSATLDGKSIEARGVRLGEIYTFKDRIEFEASAKKLSMFEVFDAEGLEAKVSVNKSFPIRADFDVKTKSVSGKHKLVSSDVIEVSTISASGRFEAESKENWKVDVHAGLKNAKISLLIEKNEELFHMFADMGWTKCQSVMEAVPAETRQILDGIKFSGSMKATCSISLGMDSNEPSVRVNLEHKCSAVEVPEWIKSAMSGKPFKRTIYTKDGIPKDVTSSVGNVSVDSISPYMIKAIVATEDPGFWSHNGFDTAAIRNSISENVKKRKFVRGASTLHMQLAKNMFLKRNKDMSRKLQEFFLTVVISQEMSKEKILGAYLSLAEFGPDLYGIGPACEHYFETNPSRLSLAQSVFLASILPKPKAQYFGIDGKLGNGKKRHIELILDAMEKKGAITKEECEIAKHELDLGNFKKTVPTIQLDTSEWGISE